MKSSLLIPGGEDSKQLKRNHKLEDFMIKLLAAITLSAGLSCAGIITLSDPNQTGNANDTLMFQGTLTNPANGTNPLFINGDVVDVVLTFDDSMFLNKAPISIPAPGSSGPFLFFTVALPGVVVPGTVYNGTFTLIGGVDGNDQQNLDVAPFSITVPTPEPSTILLAAPLALLYFRRPKKF
jgi:hypothetical protein